MSTSTKPYLIRALHQWCTDNEQTPYLVVHVDGSVTVPLEFVKDNEIVLNIGYNATKNLQIDNDWLSFSARFGGVSRDIWVPIGNVLSIFSRETGEGMGFELEPVTGERPQPTAEPESAVTDTPASGKGKPSRSHLRIVK
ncbi:ClpXP protease specificity-enhancing factor [Vogesella indigofera]|uniref:ClpXP protease specificity-enhancing factor n=1 Tax=Vogesella indigofera TaxID=45465 RepID=UPI00234F7DFE|nr:ClpXP protease specificity-enhancing factor [Vogesella indigofera]MDC7711997.1 ClpXP protease specificity-enhancing factor [Vogesella indigofera]